MDKKVALIGVPLDLGAENLGVDVGPHALRVEKIVQKLEKAGLKIDDLGDIYCMPREKLHPGNPKLKYLEEILRVSHESAEKTYKAIKEGDKVLAIGGDHSVNLGVMSGASVALKGNIGMIYLDAHGDLNTDKTTLSGNIHGMHVASLLGFGEKKLTYVYMPAKKLLRENLLLIGGKDFDKEEDEFIQEQKIKSFTMMDLLANGMKPLFNLIDEMCKLTANIWVSLDLDVIDGVYAPGVGIPNVGGLTYREITAVAKYIGENCNVVGMDLVEYNPLRDIDKKTAELSIELCAKILGANYSPYSAYMERNKI